MNMYAYVGNDPVNGVDPTGLCLVTNYFNIAWTVDPDTGGPVPGTIDIWSSGAETLGCEYDERGYMYMGGYAYMGRALCPDQYDGHCYDVPTTTVCDSSRADCEISDVDAKVCVLPGRTSSESIVSGDTYWVGVFNITTEGVISILSGYVTTAASEDRMTFTNTTTLFHPLSGSVTRQFEVTGDGSIRVTTVGTGDAFLPTDTINEIAGPELFRRQNILCRNHLEGL